MNSESQLDSGAESSPQLSVVVPCFNEEDNVRPLLDRLIPVLEGVASGFEVIFVDDGSSDNTTAVVAAARAQDDRVKLVEFSRNFGKEVALSAGLEYASGEAIISLDADLQHPPELIPELVERWREGSAIVVAIRDETEGAGWAKEASSRLFYRVLNGLTGLKLPLGTTDFRLLDSAAASALCACGEPDRFLRGLVHWIGFPQAHVHYRAEARHAGQTKYGWRKLLGLAVDAAMSFSVLPLRLAIYLGLGAVGVGLIYGLYAFLMKVFTARPVPGWTSLMLVLVILGGTQLVMLGIVGEYLGRTYRAVQSRPLYVVARSEGLRTHGGIQGNMP
ncbi:MAG: glycosyltransferase [Armatimonadota bacterium]|nr:glycosyltransferase [Armatimonadota bacterium]